MKLPKLSDDDALAAFFSKVMDNDWDDEEVAEVLYELGPPPDFSEEDLRVIAQARLILS